MIDEEQDREEENSCAHDLRAGETSLDMRQLRGKCNQKSEKFIDAPEGHRHLSRSIKRDRPQVSAARLPGGERSIKFWSGKNKTSDQLHCVSFANVGQTATKAGAGIYCSGFCPQCCPSQFSLPSNCHYAKCVRRKNRTIVVPASRLKSCTPAPIGPCCPPATGLCCKPSPSCKSSCAPSSKSYFTSCNFLKRTKLSEAQQTISKCQKSCKKVRQMPCPIPCKMPCSMPRRQPKQLCDLGDSVKQLHSEIKSMKLQCCCPSTPVCCRSEIMQPSAMQLTDTPRSMCQFCGDKQLSVCQADLICQVIQLIGPRTFDQALLMVMLHSDNLFHVNVREWCTRKVLGCIPTCNAAIEEAAQFGLFNNIFTFCVIDVRSTIRPRPYTFAITFEYVPERRQCAGEAASEMSTINGLGSEKFLTSTCYFSREDWSTESTDRAAYETADIQSLYMLSGDDDMCTLSSIEVTSCEEERFACQIAKWLHKIKCTT